jgi:5-methylcytosine-specific restriction protein A
MAWSKESRHTRGYGTAWDKLRLRILERDMHLCQCAECAKRLVPLPATEVNHKTSKAEAKRLRWTEAQIDDPSNLEAINTDCHKRVTKEQQGYTLRPKVTTGADGWPVT